MLRKHSPRTEDPRARVDYPSPSDGGCIHRAPGQRGGEVPCPLPRSLLDVISIHCLNSLSRSAWESLAKSIPLVPVFANFDSTVNMA